MVELSERDAQLIREDQAIYGHSEVFFDEHGNGHRVPPREWSSHEHIGINIGKKHVDTGEVRDG